MLGRTLSAGTRGLDGFLITVEAAIGGAAPTLRVVGHSDGPLVAAAERASAAIDSCALALPARAQFIHVAPSSQRKHARGIDLAIACALLVAHGVLTPDSLDGVLVWGELASDGRVLAVPGTLLAAETARHHDLRVLALACTSAAEAAAVPELDLLRVPSLAALIAHLRGEATLPRGPARAEPNDPIPLDLALPDPAEPSDSSSLPLELMLAGGHHLLVITPRPLLVDEHALTRLLPTLTPDEAIELTKIHDLVEPTRLLRVPRVRRPSGHASRGELFGSGYPTLRPGEVSLAHRGVLILDDLHGLASHDTLRRVLEQRSVELDGVHFPARARLLATTTSAAQIPATLRDRFDLVVPDEGMVIHGDARPRIVLARARQRERLSPTPWSWNAEIPRIGDALPYLCRCHARRQYDPRVLRVARTIADLQPDRDAAEPLDADTLALAERLVMEGR